MLHWILISAIVAAAPPGPGRTSSIALTPDDRIACAANEDSASVSLWTWAGGGAVREVPVGEDPRTVAVAPDGKTLCVTAQRSGTLDVVDIAEGRRTASIDLGGQPYGVILAPGGGRAFVSLYAGGYVDGKYRPGLIAAVELPAGKVAARIPVPARPWAMALAADGRRLLVTHFLHLAGDGAVTEIDAGELAVRRTFLLTETTGALDGRCGVFNALAGIAIHPDGRRAAVAGQLSNVRRGTSVSGRPLSHKTIIQAAVAVLDLDAGREMEGARILSSFSGQAVSVPAAVAFLGRGEHIVDVYFGSNDFKVLAWDERGVVAERALRSLPAGPTGIAVTADGATAFFACRWARSLARVSLADPRDPVVAEIRRATAEPWTEERIRGATLFHDARDTRVTANRWIACGGCHLEGGLISDGLVWDVTVPGEPPKVSNTLDLALAPGTAPPFFHRGAPDALPALEDFLKFFQKGSGLMGRPAAVPPVGPVIRPPAGTGGMGGSGGRRTARQAGPPASADWAAIAVYLSKLTPRPSPHMAGGLPRPEIREAAARGRRLFFDPTVGCGRCHDGPRLTVSGTGRESVFDVGTGGPFDTPTLLHLWDTAPYLHDGSAATLREVLTTRNGEDTHGKTSHLKPAEIDDLVAFLLAPYGDENEKR